MAAPPPEVDLTPWAVAVAAAGAVVGPKFAAYVGAYALIFVGWFAGLLYGLYKRPADSKMPVWAYAVFTLLVSLGATVTLAQFAADYVPAAYTALLFPVAAAIPAMPDKWADAGNWLIDRVRLIRDGGKQGGTS